MRPRGTWSARRATAAAVALLVALSLAQASGAGSASGASAERDAGDAPRRATGVEVDLTGGDVVMLPRPHTVRADAIIGTAWSDVGLGSVPSLPDAGVGAVVLEVVVSRAHRSGTVRARPLGAQGAGTAVTPFRTAGGEGLALVKVGTDATVQVSSSRGSPRGAVRVVGWMPETAAATAPEAPPLTTTQVGTSRRTLRLPAVPQDAQSVLVQLTTRATRGGILRSWTAGTPRPTRGTGYGSGVTSVVDVVSRGADGRLALQVSRGRVSLDARVLGWTLEGATTRPLPDPQLGTVRPGGVRAIRVAGAHGVPAEARQVWLTMTAPPGAAVEVWGNANGSGTPLHAWRSGGGGTPLLLRVPATGRIAVKVTGTRAGSTLLAHGYAAGVPDNQQVVLEPREGTHLLGASDVEELATDRLRLVPSADAVAVGDHLQLRGPDGLPYTLQVTGTAATSAGGQEVSIAPATLAEAFADARLHYGTPDPGSPRRVVKRVPAAASAASGASLGAGSWTCSTGGSAPAFSLDFSGDPYLDVNLGAGTVDFSLRGAITASAEWTGSQSFSCTYASTLAQIPMGTLPLALKLGPSATATINPSGEDATVTLSGTQRVFTSIYYDGSDAVTGKALSGEGSSESQLGRGSAQLDIGLNVAVGAASLGALEIGPEASVTLGASYQLAPPDPSDDPLGRHLAGPHCTDLTNTLFVSTGASLLVPFLPDVSVDIARFDTPAATLDRGPCVGYAGTITYTYRGSNVQGASSCDDTPEPCSDWDHTVVKTLVPQPASLPQTGYVSQPYAWTWTGRDRGFVKNTSDGISWNLLCSTTDTYSGAGSVGWEPFDSPEGWPAPAIFTGTNSEQQVSAQMYVDHGRGRDERTIVDADGDDGFTCGEPGVSEVSLPGADYATPGVGGAELWRPSITVVGLGNAQFPGDSEARFQLTRQEFARD